MTHSRMVQTRRRRRVGEKRRASIAKAAKKAAQHGASVAKASVAPVPAPA